MDAGSGKPLPAFGFVTVHESAEHGLFGGYLVLSSLGRPLEFRCSTPVVPSRAQQILYGPTLRPYLLSEVIGQALVGGSELPVETILTNQRDMLMLGVLRRELVIHVERATGLADRQEDGAFPFAGCRVTPAEVTAATSDEIKAILAPLAANVDLCEPFDRILAALTEAQMASHDAADTGNDRAAAA